MRCAHPGCRKAVREDFMTFAWINDLLVAGAKSPLGVLAFLEEKPIRVLKAPAAAAVGGV